MESIKFSELPISAEIRQAIEEMGFSEASPIQAQAIPFLLQGEDLIGQAQTGTGKTAAFGIPAIEMIDTSDKSVQAVVMCPTRELAVQVAQELKKLAKFRKGVNLLAIYGGESIEKQIGALKRGVQIVIGTPGRIMDHLDRRTLKFNQVKMVILDEADEMLNMGFREDIESILSTMPKERQTVFFSATMAKPIMSLTKKYQNNPQLVKITRDQLTVASIDQVYFEVKSSDKMELMSRLIDMHELQLSLVFCNTKKKVDEVVEELQQRGYKAEGIHGDLRQNQRNQVMAKFRSGQVNLLVATDVAARGIDVDDVDAVFNYDMPLDDEYYVHRIGRTGRAGKSGKAFSFVTGREVSRLKEIQYFTKVKIQKGIVPSGKEMAESRKIKFFQKLKAMVEEGDLEVFDKMAGDFAEEGLPMRQMAAALLKMVLGDKKGSGDLKEDKKKPGLGRSSRRGGNMVRLFINVGKKDKVRPGDIVGAIAGEANISGDLIGSIDIYDKFSFVELPEDIANEVMDIMIDNKIKGKKINMEIAKGK